MSSKSSNSCARTLSIAAARNGAPLCDGMQTLTLAEEAMFCVNARPRRRRGQRWRSPASLDHRRMDTCIGAEHVWGGTNLLKPPALQPQDGLAYLSHLIKVVANKDHGASCGV